MSQYLGDISAYALAVSQGYTGTEEEYAELMASYATVGQTAVTAAQTATTKASEAATSATTATNKASEAATSATTATNKAAEAHADADAAALDASQALSAASTATTKATEATTAATTATSAKTDAVAANTAAQSAKTAAQTAQTGAETAAASVQSSAAQIQTNAEDINQLKSELSTVYEISFTEVKDAPANSSYRWETPNIIPEGDSVTFVNNSNTGVTLNVQDANGTETYIGNVIANGGEVTFVAPFDIAYIRSWVSTSPYSVAVRYGEYKLPNMITDNFKRLGFASSTFSCAQGATHSSTKDKAFIDVKSGETVYISVKCDVETVPSLNLHAYNGTTGIIVGNQAFNTNDALIRLTATQDYDSFGLYVGTTSQDINFELCVFKEDSIALSGANHTNFITNSMAKNGYAYFDVNDFTFGGMTNGVATSYVNRICTYPTILSYPYALNLTADSGFKFGIHFVTSAGAFIKESGWQTSYTVPANTLFRVIIARQTDIDAEIANIFEFVEKVHFLTNSASKVNTDTQYNYSGEPIDFKRHGYDVSSTGISIPTSPDGTTSPQGFAIYDGVLFQLYSNDKVKLVNFATGQVITTLDITCDHGDTMDFSDEFYDQSDEFPLAYITSDATPAKVYVVRITRTATTLIRTYLFADSAKTGYYAGHCLDTLNNILYTVGYSENSYYMNENGTNRMIVASWDLSNCTTNQDGTLTPAFIKSFTAPFMITVQGQRYFDGKLFLLSSHWTDSDTKIYVIDPFKGIITNIMDDLPQNLKTNECEAIDFVLNDYKYDMILSGYSRYNRLTFS